MNLGQLEKAIQELCKYIGSGVKWESTIGDSGKSHQYYIFDSNEVWYGSLKIEYPHSLRHIYWSIAYQAIRDANISFDEAEKIYKQNI